MSNLDNFENELRDVLNPQPLMQYFGFPNEDQLDIEVVLPENERDRIASALKSFYGFNEVIWTETPFIETENGVKLIAKSSLPQEEEYMSYKGQVCYIYSIAYTPLMYSREVLNVPVEDGIVITPPLYIDGYDADSVMKSLRIEWKVEEFSNQDDEINSILRRVETALRNEKKYNPSSTIKALIRFAVD